jgi:cytochrome c biogenesis protein CcmG, thiol:disulfide interchange protein DsbE
VTAARKSHRSPTTRLLGLFLIGAGLVVFAGIAALFLLDRDVNAGDVQFSVVPAEVNFAAPDVELTDLAGNPVSLADYHGKVVLLNNWTTWCPPCREEMPVLKAYHDEHTNQNFSIIAVDAGEPAADVRRYAEAAGLSFPVWLDPDMDVIRLFRNNGLPSSYVIDENGTVVLAWNGAITRAALEKYVTPLLEN